MISKDIEQWQAMNVLGHMAVGLGAKKDDVLMGRDTLVDRSGVVHAGISRYGLVIKEGSSADIVSVVHDAKAEEGVIIVDFPRQMLDTKHDDELALALETSEEHDLEYLGVLLYGPSEQVNRLTKSFKLWS